MKIYFNDRHRLHDPPSILTGGQPFETEETPRRAEILLEAVAKAGLGVVILPDDHGLEPVLAVHETGYVDFLMHAYEENHSFSGQPGPVFPETFAPRAARRNTRHPVGRRGYYAFGVGTPILEGTWEAAYWSTQTALSAAGSLLAGERSAYALCRPPGHHADVDHYGGFCFLNNAAIAARALGGRVAILDIDYHHGNGTQEIFYTDPDVLYCSLHADPDEDYPYFWGEASERGEGAGEGANWNCPLPKGTGDTAYLEALESALAVIRSFRPERLVVSAGFDCGENDPAGGFRLTEAGFAEIGRRVAGLELPTLIVQEGGYRLDTLGRLAVAFLRPFA